jgi:dTDP-4-dehydrorhamnose 3,5-epimerase
VPFHFERLRIPDLVLIRPTLFRDARGYFLETYKRSDFAQFGLPGEFVQDNHSHSARGVLRGMHFQRPPAAQAKLVSAVRGDVFDVAVDIRRGSPWYGQWVGVVLSESNRHLLFVPAGFAHGFCVLSDAADVTYKVTAEYDPDRDAGIRWDDPEICIEWPVSEPTVSSKDTGLPSLASIMSPFCYGSEGAEQSL